MLVKTILILSVATVGGPTAWLDVSDAVRIRPKDTQKSFRMHRAGADLYVVRLLQNATLLHPKMRER